MTSKHIVKRERSWAEKRRIWFANDELANDFVFAFLILDFSYKK